MVVAQTDVVRLLISYPYGDKELLSLQLAKQARAHLAYCAGTRHADDMDTIASDLGGHVNYPSINAPDFVMLDITQEGMFYITHPFMKGPRLDNLNTAEGIGMYLIYAIGNKKSKTRNVYPRKGVNKDIESFDQRLRFEGLRFAFNFLMPEDIFRARVALYRAGNKIGKKNMNDNDLISHLGVYFAVSPYVLHKRLQHFDLVNVSSENKKS